MIDMFSVGFGIKILPFATFFWYTFLVIFFWIVLDFLKNNMNVENGVNKIFTIAKVFLVLTYLSAIMVFSFSHKHKNVHEKYKDSEKSNIVKIDQQSKQQDNQQFSRPVDSVSSVKQTKKTNKPNRRKSKVSSNNNKSCVIIVDNKVKRK